LKKVKIDFFIFADLFSSSLLNSVSRLTLNVIIGRKYFSINGNKI